MPESPLTLQARELGALGSGVEVERSGFLGPRRMGLGGFGVWDSAFRTPFRALEGILLKSRTRHSFFGVILVVAKSWNIFWGLWSVPMRNIFFSYALETLF